jgi:oligopeptide transport system permease protein
MTEHIPSEEFLPAGDAFALPEVARPAPKGYAADAWGRFRKNRSSVVAGVIILALLLFAIFTPMLSPYDVSTRDGYYKNVLPKFRPLAFLGWDGCATRSCAQAACDYYRGIGQESGNPAVKAVKSQIKDENTGLYHYKLEIDTYEQVGFQYVDVSVAQYEAIRKYEEEAGLQVLYPLPRYYQTTFLAVPGAANLWYELADETKFSSGLAKHHDENGNAVYVADYLKDEAGNPVYAAPNQTGLRCRVLYSAYYRYLRGYDPVHPFGTNQHGQDILVCLAYGARLSFLLALGVSVINFLIGIAYGAVEGFYGGRTDLVMERISDILAAVPFIVVATLFQLHLAQRAGPVASLLFAFVLTGWIGIASRVRREFYRFKNAEYVLSSRTLGASDGRLIFRHILPNSLGTIITGTILMIPGVIFSESMLSYLGIVNLEASRLTSIGTMLSAGRAYLGSFPHILFFPAAFIALLQISFNLFGNGLRDALNPTLRQE